MGRFDGKVAFITGAARGQGREHAVRLAAEGADIIAVDICGPVDSVPYPASSPEDLARTAAMVREQGQGVVTRKVDVRDEDAVRGALQAGSSTLGPVDIVVANAGIWSILEHPTGWQDTLDVNLTGVMHTVEAAYPSMVESGRGGAIVLTSSTAGLVGIGGPTRGGLAYNASKHALVGLMKFYANHLAQHSIRVNTIHPTGVSTEMVENTAMDTWVRLYPDRAARLENALPVARLEVGDVSDALLWLASDEARYITGVALPVDAGFSVRR